MPVLQVRRIAARPILYRAGNPPQPSRHCDRQGFYLSTFLNGKSPPHPASIHHPTNQNKRKVTRPVASQVPYFVPFLTLSLFSRQQMCCLLPADARKSSKQYFHLYALAPIWPIHIRNNHPRFYYTPILVATLSTYLYIQSYIAKLYSARCVGR